MNWLTRNINHFTIPLGMLLGLLAAFIGFRTQSNRRAGLPIPFSGRGFRGFMIVLVVVCGILLGIALAHNRG